MDKDFGGQSASVDAPSRTNEKSKHARAYHKTKKVPRKRKSLTLQEDFDKIWGGIPDEEWAKIPEDASLNLDHYLYGSPKR